jgi:K+-transporting ATPase ATPase C chain
LRDSIAANVKSYREENGLDANSEVPADAVTASGSGLDPHISPANAYIQARRVARARNIPMEELRILIDHATDGPDLGMFGEARVNVLVLNLELDRR